MDIISWIVVGGLAGWVASMIVGTDTQMDVVSNVVVGILGALIGGWVVTLFGGPQISGFNFYSFLVAVLGSIVLLGLVRGFQRPVLR